MAAALVVCALVLSSCAGKKDEAAWPDDRRLVLSRLKTLAEQQEQTGQKLANIDKRLIELEARLTKQGSEQEATKAAVVQLRADIANLKRATARSRRTSRITKRKLVKKLDRIAKTITTPPPVVAGASAVAARREEAEKNAYTAAYLALKSGRFDEAIEGFRKLLHDFPKGKFADQAWYWLGESHYAKRDVQAAIRAWETVARQYPDSPKHPVALLKLGIAHKQQGHAQQARQTLERLIRLHPDSAAAENARNQLKALAAPADRR